MDDKKPRDYKKPTLLLIALTAVALLAAALSLSLRQRQALPAQASPADDGLHYYTPKAAASQESGEGSSQGEDGPYRVAVHEGKIGVFRPGESEPFLTADVEVYLLPEEDIALLRAGLTAQTLSDVRAILEDYE